MIEWIILLVISHQCHSVLMHHSAIFILRTESHKTIAMHCHHKTIHISASFHPFFMIQTVFNSQEAHLSNGIRTRKNGYVLAEIWSAQAESKKHCNSFVRHCTIERWNILHIPSTMKALTTLQNYEYMLKLTHCKER